MAYSIALRITADASLAEDVVQDAFLGAWRNAARYVEGRGSVKTWLLSIVHHRAVDAVRRRRPTTELPEREAPPPPALTLPDVWQEVAGNLDREAIAAALATLSDVQREAIELAYFGGLTQHEIADRTGTPLGTVKSRVRLGLLAMRAALTGEADRRAARRTRHDDAADAADRTTTRSTSPRSTSWARSSDAEEAAVREHLATCPESHAEFEELGGVVPYLLESPDVELVEPPAALGDRIMAAAAADLAERTAAERTTPAPAAERTAPVPFPSADERTARAERTRSRPGPLDWVVGDRGSARDRRSWAPGTCGSRARSTTSSSRRPRPSSTGPR